MPLLSVEHQEKIEFVMAQSPLIPVITIRDPDDAIPLCRALFDGGIRALEITLRTEHGLDAIRRVREALPDAIVGAGTVISIDQYRDVERAGAEFVITPGVTDAILDPNNLMVSQRASRVGP